MAGGHKARPYGRLVNPSGRGGVYPRLQQTGVALAFCAKIAQFRFDLDFSEKSLKRSTHVADMTKRK
jgi:hypothetical protein